MTQLLTDFADQAVILPVAALALLGLLLSGWGRAALAWAMVVPLTLLLVLASKMVTFACVDSLPGSLHLRSPSGHTAAAALVYGGLMGLLLPITGRRTAALLSASFFAVIIGGSRIRLGAHSFWDVLAGGAIGITGAWTVAWLAGPRPVAPRRGWALPAVLALAAGILQGSHLEAEAQIQDYARSVWPFRLCEGLCRNCSSRIGGAPPKSLSSMQ